MRKIGWMTGLALVGMLATACSGPKDPFSYAFGEIEDASKAVRRKLPVPVIAQAFPEAAAAGDAMVLTGEHFGKSQGKSTLTIAGVEVAVDSWSDEKIEFTVGTDLPGGPQDAVVTVGPKASEPYKVGISPTLKSISPSAGSGGKLVTLRGTNFGDKQGKGIVKAGGVTMLPKSWKRDAVTFLIPDTLDAGRREIKLDIGGVVSNLQFFTVRPVVAAAAPARGVPESAFTISGTNFGGAQAGGKVLFGGAELSVVRWGATAIDVTVPFAASAGAKSFTVTAGNQTSNPGSYTVAAPSLGGLTPGYAFAGATVTLTGADFGSAQRGSQLLLDGAAVTPLSWSNGQVSFVVPNAVAAGNHTLAVRVGTLTSAVQPLVVRPTVTRVRPQAGPAGTLVTVDGYGFGVTGVVRLGNDALVPLAWSNTAVVFAVATTAPVAAMVTVESGGQLSNGVVFTVTAPGAPVIQSLTPAAGLAGTSVLVAGQNLGAAAGQVSIGGTLVTPTAWSSTLVGFTVPALPTGTKSVFLLVGGNPTNALPFAVSTATSPWITSLTPASGNAGTVLTINGVRFGAAKGTSTVTVGGVVAATSSWSATQIRAAVPAGAAAGILDVVVTVNAEDSNSVPFVLAPAISAVTPAAGVAGDTITLTGTAFGAAQGASLVYFDGVSAAVTAWSAGSINVVVPNALAAGAHAVWVVVGGQPSNSVPFSVSSAPAPAIGAVSPVGGVAGTLVTLSGTRFGASQGTSTLTLGGVLVTPTSWSNSTLVFAIPDAPAAGIHDLVVTVNGLASNAWPLPVAPSIRSLTPPAGTAATTLVVAGANFGAAQGASTLVIGGVVAPVTGWANGLIAAALPAGLTPGPNDVYVVVGGQASNSASFYLAAATQPVITSLTPAAGMVGDLVTAAGANFGATPAALTVGGQSAVTASWSDTAVGFTVPALATGSHFVRVTTGAGASNDFRFTVTTPTSPWITNVAPLAGSSGTLIVVTGARFGTPGVLTIGGVPASISTWTNTTIYASVPALAAGIHAVVVTTTGAENSNNVDFTLRPVVNGLAPVSAIADQQVTLTGADFGAAQGASVVSVGGTPAAVDSWSNTSITFRVPTSLAAGAYGVSVRVNGQNSNSVGLTSLGALVIVAVNPASGSGGTSVALTGANFGAAQGASTLTLGGTPASVSAWTPTAVTFTVNDLTPAGARAIALTVSGVAANVTSFTVLPSLINVFPTGGPVGTDVTLTGTNFGASGALYLGAYAVPTQSWSSTAITFRVPAGYTAGTYAVSVVSGGQTSNALDYQVTANSSAAIIGGIAPTSAQAGDTVTLTGINFGATQSFSTLHFDTGTLTPVAWYDNTVTFNAPAVAPGTYDVFVTVNGTASNKVAFSVTTATSPILSSVSPRAGPAGTAISLVGTSFGAAQGGSTVTVGGAPAAIGGWADTLIAASIPTSLDAGIHNVVVTVNGEASNAVTFTVRPAVTGLNPTSGVAGDPVVITGTSFGAAQGASQVLIDGVAAAVTAWANGSITFTVPNSVPAGNLSVVVRVNGQVSNTQTFTVTAAGDPLISSLAPTVGSAGTQVVIAGTRFGSTQGASSVVFGGTAPTIVSWSASAIVVEVPGTIVAGPQNITVTVNGQVSNAAAFVVQPSLTALVPAGGAAGFAVTASGLNFGAAQGASRIYMAGVSAAVTAWANDRIDFTVPAGLTPGLQSVRVEVNGQFSNARNFAYAAPGAPALFGLTPSAGMVGATVAVAGANFGTNPAAVAVDIGGSAATPANLTATSFEFTVPALPTGTHDVVATVGGTSSNAVGFTVTTPTSPWITSVVPSSGPVGANLVISGTQFGASATLTIGGTAVAPVLWTDTLILAVVPNAVPAGLQGIVVAHAGENSNTVDFALRPDVSTVVPASGVAGDNVTVTGTSFGAVQGTGGVTLGGVTAAVQSWSDTSVVVQVPAGAAAGNVYLVLTQGGQPSNSMAFTISSAAAPAIAGLDVTFGVAGQTVTVSGSRFGATQGASSLVLGGAVISPATWSNTSITFVVPADLAAGAQTLVVNVAGQASNPATFTILPTAGSVTPIAGVVGTSVTLTGANFGAAQGSSTVTVGGTTAAVTAWGMNSLTFTVPAVALGAQAVVVTVGGQASNGVSFFVTSGSGPVITGIAPAAGLAGTAVTLTGANFGASGTLTFGGSVIASTAWNATQVQFMAPALAPGSYDVVVDTGVLSNPVAFTITSATSPWIDTVTPASGASGDLITITGQRFGAFAGASSVTVGGVAATLVGWSDTLLQVRVPAAAAAGLRPIVVTVGGEASNSFVFTVRPAITSLSPAAGDIGTILTINGTGFGASGGVIVGGVAAAVQSWSSAAIAVTVPTSLTGGAHDVVVTANGQLSNTVSYLVTTGLPLIASLSPTSGTAGTVVTVSGSNFGGVQGANTIAVGGLTVTPTSWSGTSIVFTLPAQVPGGVQNVVVTVAGVSSPAEPFTAQPYIATALPAQVWSGDVVTVTGSGFGAAQGGSSLTVGGVSIVPATWSHTAITFALPANAAPGSQALSVAVGGQVALATLDVRPDITNVTPAAATAGQAVVVTGTNFGASGSLTVGGVAVVPTWSATSVGFTLPSGVTAGVQAVLLTAGGHVTDATMTVAPSISSVSPATAVSGDTVTITGTNFGAAQGGSTLTALGTAVAPASWSQTSITFTLPAAIAAGAGNVVVTVGGQSVSSAFAVNPRATGAFPSPATAGETVTLSGASFGASQGASTLTLGGTAIAPASWSVTAVTFVVPANGTAGAQTIAVAVNGRAASTTLTIDPTITALTAAGVAGDTFTIAGTNFGPSAASLTVGGMAVTPAAWTATSISFVLPATIPGGARTVAVTVNGRTASGTITVAPNITGVAPGSGAVGAAVTLTGAGFGASQGASTLTLAGTTLTPTSWSDTSIGFQVPAGITAGAASIVLTVGGQTDSQAFTVLPSIVSVTPSSASFGDAVAITGANFGSAQGASVVQLNGVALAVAAWSDAQIDFTLPATAPGGVRTLSLTVGGQVTSATLTVVPKVASLTPGTGSSGVAVVAAGGNFGAAQGGSTITLGGVALTPTAWSDTSIGFAVPSNVAAGLQDFVAVVGGQTSAAASFTVDITVSGAAPATATNGTSVTVSGTNFGGSQGASTLTLAGVSVAPTSWNHTAVAFAVPANVTAGTRTLALTVGGRTGTASVTIDPSITLVAPSFGGAGTTVTLTGANFGAAQGASTITLGGVAVTVTAWSQTSISFTVPNTVSAGAQMVVVTVGGRSASTSFTVTNSLTSIAPASGTAGTAVTVTGSNFGAVQGGSSIALGGVALVPTSWTDTSIQFTVPNNVTAGVQSVVVTVGGQPTAGSFTVLPAIGTVGSAAATGGDSVVLTGTNFGAVKGSSSVTVGGVAATTTAWSHTSLTFTMPGTVTAGAQSIVVTVGGQAVAASITVNPNITSVTPASGGAGAAVTLGGTNFGPAQGGASLTLGGLALTAGSWSQTSISFTVPANVTGGTQPVVVAVNGRSDAASFTVQHAITSLTPGNGTAGTTVTVAGSGFGATEGSNTIDIGGVVVSPSVWSQTSLEFTVPPGVTAGTRNVTVTVAGVAVTTPFAVEPSISMLSGGFSYGEVLTVTGSNFGDTQGASTIKMDGVAVSPTAWSDSSISFVIPNNVTGGDSSITVTVGGQYATIGAFSVYPTISAITPNVATGGDSVTLTGANFSAAQASGEFLTLDGQSVIPTAWSFTSMAFSIPNDVTAGTHTVAVEFDGATTSVSLTVDPTLVSVTPATGGSGTVVVVAGTNFGAAQGASTLTLGGRSLTASAWSQTSLTFTVPSNVTAGTQPVVLTVGGRSDTLNFTVTHSVASVSPQVGPVNTAVTVSGANFGATQGSSTLTLAGSAITPTAWNDTSLAFSVPSNVTAGTQPLVVRVAGAPVAATFAVEPTIVNVAPAIATGGASVTVAGANFGAAQGGSTLTLGGLALAATAWSHTSITFTVPNTVTGGTLPLVLSIGGRVTNATLAVDPAITNVAPASGGSGTSVTLTGTNFGALQGASTLTLGGVTIGPTAWAHTSLSFTVPNGVTAGTQPLVVTVGGRSDSASFTVAHSIASLTPASGTSGTVVTVAGTGFGAAQGASEIRIGGVLVAATVWSQTSLEFTVPGNVTAGTQNVTVRVAGVDASASFTVQPSVANISPVVGRNGVSVTLLGTNFGAAQGASTVTVGGVAMTPTAWSHTSLTFTLSSAVTAGTQPVVVTVGGQTASTTFTVDPAITNVAPSAATGGTSVVLTGANLGAVKGASTLTLAGVGVSTTAWGMTSLTFTVPNAVTAGVQTLVATVGGRTTDTTFTVDPYLASLSPAAGTGGTVVTVAGTNLGATQGASVLTFGGATVVASAWSMNSLTFTVPSTVAAGANAVQVTVGGRTSNLRTFTLAPYIAALSPATGSGGTTVTLAGQNFGSIQGASGITVGGVAVTAVSWSNSSLTFDIPNTLVAGVHNVVVTVGGQASNARSLAVDPTLASLTPANGAAGTAVTVAGTNFGATPGTSVLTIGGVVTAPTAWSATSISFAVPATVAAGVQNVVVTVGGRTSNAAAFTLAPSLSNVTPSSGVAGATVTVTGANFGAVQGLSTLTLGAATLTPSAWSMTSISFTVPSSLAAGAHSVQVTVGGQASNTPAFTIRPSITAVSPQVGGGGTTVTVTGGNFGASADSLTLGGSSVTPDSWSNLSITFTVTNAMLPGVQNVVVTVGAQASDPVTFAVRPALSNLTPASGNPGESVTLNGTNFGPSAGTVKFGTSTAVVTSWSNLSIVATVPALSAAAYDVTVIAGGVTSNTLAYTVTGTYGIASAETLDCEPVDGIIDHYKVTYSAAVTDSTFDGYVLNGMGLSTARWSVAGHTNPRLHHGTALPAACGVDVANDNVHYLMFDPGASPDTGVKPDLTGTATLVKIAATGKRLYNDTGTWTSTDVVESDKAAPYIYLAVAAEDDVSGSGFGVDVNDTLELRYSETTNAPALGAADLNTLVELRNASNVLHSLGAAGDRLSAVWMASSSTNDTLRITFANANPTVAVGDKVRAQGSLITDLAANTPAPIAYVTSPPLVTGTFDPGFVGPKVLTAAYYDLDADGYLDHLRLVFDKAVNDTTFPGYVGRNAVNAVTSLWQVAGYNNVRLDTYDTVDGMGGADNAELWIVFDEGAAPDTGMTPDVTATLGSAGLRDTDGCYINADNAAPGCAVAAKARLSSADVVEGDKAPPVIVRVSGKVGGNRLYVSFSEAVYGASGAPICGSGAEIAAADFTYGNVNAGGATGIASMDTDVCAIDDKQVAVVTTGLIAAGDINADYVRVASGTALYDGVSNAMRSTDQRVIIDTTAPYLVAASSFRFGGKYYIRVVYSEPVQALTATVAANYSVVESPANASCTDFSPTPLSVAQVSSTVYDLETGTQCGTATTPDTYYLVTANNILDVNENELIGSPNFATTLGTDPADATRPRLLEAVAVTPLTVRLTYSEPMRPGDVAGSAECAATYAPGRKCTDDVDAGAANTQLKYTINPTLGNVSQVVATANPSVFILTHQNAQSGGFYTITAYASNAVAAIPVDPTGNLLMGQPDNQVTFQGQGSAILDLEDGPLFSDPFVDGTSFSYAFKYANRVYLGPNDANSGAFRFEADGLNPTSVAFQGPALNADGTTLSCPYASSFGVAGSISCITNWGPNAETGLVGFDSGKPVVGGTPYEILMVGAIKNNVSHVYFTQDVDTTLNWISCPLSSFTGGGNTKSVQNTYTFADSMYAGISSNHNTQAPILIKTPLTVSGGVLSCNVGTDLSVRQVAWIGKGGSPANPAVNTSSVGVDTMIMVPGTTGNINPGVDTFYIANNGGVSKSDGTPTSNASFSTVLTQTNFANYAASTADNVTLVIDSLQKISPGRKGAPKFVIYQNAFFMARNVASAQTVAGQITSAGGELWKCTTTCTSAANWTRVFTSSGAGSGTGIERATNTAVSLLEVSNGYLYVAFDNLADGARVYRTNATPAAMTSASFGEFGRVATAACSNHSGDSGALGGLCYAYQVLSDASIPKGAYSYLYLTVGCTLTTESVNGGKCDTDATAAFVPPPVRVLVQRD